MIKTRKYDSKLEAAKFALTSAAGNSLSLPSLVMTSALRAATSAGVTVTNISFAILSIKTFTIKNCACSRSNSGPTIKSIPEVSTFLRDANISSTVF